MTDNNSAPELLPCPFCGAKNPKVHLVEATGEVHSVECKTCFAECSDVAAWNRRADLCAALCAALARELAYVNAERDRILSVNAKINNDLNDAIELAQTRTRERNDARAQIVAVREGDEAYDKGFTNGYITARNAYHKQ